MSLLRCAPFVLIVSALLCLPLVGCGEKPEADEPVVASTPPADSPAPETGSPAPTEGPDDTAPMPAPGEEGDAMPAPGEGRPGGPGPGGGPRGGPVEVSQEEAAIFGPAGLPRIPGMGRPETMEFEGDETEGIIRTPAPGGQGELEVNYKAAELDIEDFSVTLPDRAELYSSWEFKTVLPEELLGGGMAPGGEGEEPAPPTSEEDRTVSVDLMVYTVAGTVEDVAADLQEAAGDSLTRMGQSPNFMVSGDMSQAVSMSAVPDEEAVQVTVTKTTMPPAFMAAMMGGGRRGGMGGGTPGGMMGKGGAGTGMGRGPGSGEGRGTGGGRMMMKKTETSE